MPANAGRTRNDGRLQTCLASLTARERDVLERVVAGEPNKVIAFELRVSIKTMEVHRARAMEKMAAVSMSELTALCIRENPDMG